MLVLFVFAFLEVSERVVALVADLLRKHHLVCVGTLSCVCGPAIVIVACLAHTLRVVHAIRVGTSSDGMCYVVLGTSNIFG